MADTVDDKLRTIAERHVRALAEDMPLQAQLLILDADNLLDQKLAADRAVVQ